MDALRIKEKLEILADAAKYDVSCSSSGKARKNADINGLGNTQSSGICHSYTPDGRCISLLKILYTNNCIYDCTYCVNRTSNAVRRASFSVEEIVWLTIEFYKRNYIEGLFLSSGIVGTPDETMEQIVEVARRLREEEHFNGYIHLKGVAGCSPDLLATAGFYADRVSANAELPTQASLDQFAPGKSQKNIFSSFKAIDTKVSEGKEKTLSGRKNKKVRVTGQSTQIVVGPGGHSDHEILSFTGDAYATHKINRVYYSAYTPVPGADNRLPSKQVPLQRENRLYQADWLLRFYGFSVSELVDPTRKNLDLHQDPKMSWALRNLHFFPMDVNRVTRDELLRVPGLGVKTITMILSARRYRQLRTENLSSMVKRWNQVKYFLITADHNPFAGKFSDIAGPTKPAYVQPDLFGDAV